MAEFAAFGLLGSAFLWGRHAFTRGSSSTWSLLSKAAAGVMVVGLVLATTLFFVAVGAAVAVAGAACYGLILVVDRGDRLRGGLLVGTALAVALAVIIGGGVSTEPGFWRATLAFSIGMGVSTMTLARSYPGGRAR